MADFLPNLWSSVFTPGTTPTLLVATNATFAALQLLLATLLVTTYSIHFAILSVLCGGLWWSINWFATELQAAQAKEDEADKLRKRKKSESGWGSKGEVGDSADDEGEDTEVEGSGPVSGTRESANPLLGESRQDDSQVRQDICEAMRSRDSDVQGSGAATGAEQAVGGAEARQRRAEEVDRSGEISTDSEWEKVSQEGDR
ncbi:SMK killer toxin resistance protein [Vermiconidia calcicola]|uniref:SMK killer toxin resistance protein n=1 Tax=Vermiconidia calcicola TaxID=1690605 RepID=A0ACC3NP90_9PEZI|nr:SMK killer toxin resistance protein [Vermiconidia calcicola]